MMEALLEGREPVEVIEHAATQDMTVHGAAKKLPHPLDSTFGRVQAAHQKGPGTPTLVADLDRP